MARAVASFGVDAELLEELTSAEQIDDTTHASDKHHPLPAHICSFGSSTIPVQGVVTSSHCSAEVGPQAGHSEYVELPPGMSDDDVSHIVHELQCPRGTAVKAYVGANVAVVCDEYRCSREWALTLLERHGFDPFLIRAHDAGGDFDFELKELWTTWGTTVPVLGEELDTIIRLHCRYLRVDPDYLTFERPEDVGDMPKRSPRPVAYMDQPDDSTILLSDDTDSACSSSSSLRSSSEFVAGTRVIAHGLVNAQNLKGSKASLSNLFRLLVDFKLPSTAFLVLRAFGTNICAWHDFSLLSYVVCV